MGSLSHMMIVAFALILCCAIRPEALQHSYICQEASMPSYIYDLQLQLHLFVCCLELN